MHIIGILLIGAAMLFGGCGSSEPELKVAEQKVIELGDEVSLKPENFLLEIPDESELEEIEVSSPLKDTGKYAWNGFRESVTDLGKSYLSNGTYDVTLRYHNRDYPTRLIVRDTTMPEFISPAAVVTIPLGSEDFDFSTIYRTEDKGTVSLRVEGDYNLNKAGTYPVLLVAEDDSGNTNQIDITLNVIADSQVIQPSDQFYNEQPVGPGENEPAANTQQPEPPADQGGQQGNTQQPSAPGACSIASLPEGAHPYTNFEEMYQAGTNWNQQNPNNFFYYTIIKDDCGNDIYALVQGTNDGGNTGVHEANPGQ